MSENRRLGLAWAIGLLSFFVLWFGLIYLADMSGARTWIDYENAETVFGGGGRYSYSEDVSGESTVLGMALIVFSGMLAYRLGAAIFTRSLNGGMEPTERVTFAAWLYGIIAIAIAEALLTVLAPLDRVWILRVLHRIVETAIPLVAFFLFRAWRERQLRRISRTSDTLAGHETIR